MSSILTIEVLGRIKHVVVVVDENTNFSEAYNSASMPWVKGQIDAVGALGTETGPLPHPAASIAKDAPTASRVMTFLALEDMRSFLGKSQVRRFRA